MSDVLEAVTPQRFGCAGRWEGMDRQDARDARGLEEPTGAVDAVASSVLSACVEVHRVLGPGFFESMVINFNVRRVVLFGRPSL